MFELSKQFRFDSAHTLKRSIDADTSRRIHGHSYRAEVVIRGTPDPLSGMIMDLGELERRIEGVRAALDHQFLDEIPDLCPATMEHLSAWIWDRLAESCPGLARISVYRDSSGDCCTYYGPGAEGAPLQDEGALAS